MATQCPGEQMQGACPSGREAFSPPPSVCLPPFLRRPLQAGTVSPHPPTAAPQSQWTLVRSTWNCHFLDSPTGQGNPSEGRNPGECAEMELLWKRWKSLPESTAAEPGLGSTDPRLSPQGPFVHFLVPSLHPGIALTNQSLLHSPSHHLSQPSSLRSACSPGHLPLPAGGAPGGGPGAGPHVWAPGGWARSATEVGVETHPPMCGSRGTLPRSGIFRSWHMASAPPVVGGNI